MPHFHWSSFQWAKGGSESDRLAACGSLSLQLRGGCLPCLLVIPFSQNDLVLYLQGLNFQCERLDLLQWVGFSAFPLHPAHSPRHGQPRALPTCDPFSTRRACHLAFPMCRPVSLPVSLIWAHLFFLSGFCFLTSKRVGWITYWLYDQEQRWASFFCKRPCSKYFRLGRPYALSQPLNFPCGTKVAIDNM